MENIKRQATTWEVLICEKLVMHIHGLRPRNIPSAPRSGNINPQLYWLEEEDRVFGVDQSWWINSRDFRSQGAAGGLKTRLFTYPWLTAELHVCGEHQRIQQKTMQAGLINTLCHWILSSSHHCVGSKEQKLYLLPISLADPYIMHLREH